MLVISSLITLRAGNVIAQSHAGAANVIESPNAVGISRTITTHATFDTSNAFFKPLGTNGRTCATCHALTEGMNMGPDFAQSLFDLTEGLDPLFATIDGTNSPRADMSTLEARRASTSMIRTKGLIRVALPVPSAAEFTIEKVEDPYSYATTREISAFRRPLPATNIRFLSTVMWDGRELLNSTTVLSALRSQVRDAVLGHMQAATPPSEQTIGEIVEFETSLYTTQVYDNAAGSLDTAQIRGAPEELRFAPFFPGINSFFSARGKNPRFTTNVFKIFRAWSERSSRRRGAPSLSQLAIARGERIFNNRPFLIRGVAGFNDLVQDRRASARERFMPGPRTSVLAARGVKGTCSSCHSTPRVGSTSLPLLMNTGVADAALRTPDLPQYTLRHNITGERIVTTDPGAAMTTGRWSDVGKFKVPSLRALETHSPYMHNGFTEDLGEVVNFYDRRFSIGLTAQEKSDLAVFLAAL